MRHVETISVSLEPRYVEILERVAKKTGSRSKALRHLLDGYARAERLEEMDRAYREYYSDPQGSRESGAWTRDMLSVSSWLHDAPPPGRRRREKR